LEGETHIGRPFPCAFHMGFVGDCMFVGGECSRRSEFTTDMVEGISCCVMEAFLVDAMAGKKVVPILIEWLLSAEGALWCWGNDREAQFPLEERCEKVCVDSVVGVLTVVEGKRG